MVPATMLAGVGAFDVALPDTCPPPATPPLPQPGGRPQLCPTTLAARTRSLAPMGVPSVSPSHSTPFVSMTPDASTTTAVASVARPRTVPAAVAGTDPRRVVTPLDPNHLERLLQAGGILSDWGHVVRGLRDSFDVGIHEPPRSTTLFTNHASADLDASFIDSYISGEQAVGRYSCAFDPIELEQVIGPFRTAPLGLVPKPHSDKFRLIQDLSYPRHDVCSFSSCCRVSL